MLKKLFGIFLLMLSLGIGLHFYLPAYEKTPNLFVNIKLDKESFDQALNIDSLLLSTDQQKNVNYGLQLGLFSHLIEAYQQANRITAPTPLSIFKATDSQRDWYLLAMGPFPDAVSSDQQRQLLKNDNHPAIQLIRWPEKTASEKEAKENDGA